MRVPGERLEPESGFHSVGSRSALKACSSGGFEVKVAIVDGILAGRMRGLERDSTSESEEGKEEKDGEDFGEVLAIMAAFEEELSLRRQLA